MTSNRRLRRPPWARRHAAQERPESTETHKAVSSQAWRTQVLPLSWIQNVYTVLILLFTIGLFIFTTIGSIGVFGIDLQRVTDLTYWRSGSWTWLWSVSMTPVLAATLGTVYQVIVQVGQFATAHNPDRRAYRWWLAASVIPSSITYLAFVSRWLTFEVWGPLLFLAWPGAAIVVVGFSLAADIAQERILVRR